jgi:glycosyltransferase involved in cell wall biosynthesis
MSIVSVIIPAYNAERTILETIASVQQQTMSDFELIIIDDGSTDRTVELVQAVEDDRLQIFSYENGGVPIARNRGIAKSNSEFIAFLDADDLWAPEKLELQLAALQAHPKAGLAYSWTYNMSETGDLLEPVEPRFSGRVYGDLLLWNFLSNGSNPLIRRRAIESVGEFCAELMSTEDWDYWLRLAMKWEFILVPKHQVFYRRSATSVSSRLDTMKQKALITLERAFALAPLDLQHLKNQSLSNVYQYYAEVYLRDITNNANSVDQVIHNLWQGVSLYPASLRSHYTQSLVYKTFLIKIFSPQIASQLFQFIKRAKAKKSPQRKSQFY